MIYPRVLIINGEPFNKNSATGITLTNLFTNWPTKKIATIYTANMSPDEDVCARNFRLGLNDLLIFNHINKPKRNAVNLNCAVSKFNSECNNKSKSSNNYKITSCDTKMRTILRAFSDLLPYRLNTEIFNWLDDFSPEIVYTYLGNIRLTDLAIRISERYKIPVVPHFMDDWIATMYNSSLFYFLQRKLLVKLVHKLFRRVPLGIGISEIMSQEYSNRFKCRFEAFMNTVPVSTEIETLTRNRSPQDSVRFCYVGGLHLSRWVSLKAIVNILEQISNAGKRVEMSIYAPNRDVQRYKNVYSHFRVVKYIGSVSAEEVASILLKADVLIHVESFDAQIRKYTRLSLSTKIPQYMASGLPILAFAPEEVASSLYIIKNGCGLVIGQNDCKTIETTLLELITKPETRKRLGQNGWKTAFKKHNAVTERERFRSVLAEAANMHLSEVRLSI